MAKINISLPDALLEEIERRAEQSGVTRSGFVQDAASHYIALLNEESQLKAREARLGKALKKMRAMAPAVGAPDAARLIRDLRDAEPRWDKR